MHPARPSPTATIRPARPSPSATIRRSSAISDRNDDAARPSPTATTTTSARHLQPQRRALLLERRREPLRVRASRSFLVTAAWASRSRLVSAASASRSRLVATSAQPTGGRCSIRSAAPFGRDGLAEQADELVPVGFTDGHSFLPEGAETNAGRGSAEHVTPRVVTEFGPAGLGHHPLDHREATEPGRVAEGLGFADAAARAHRGQIAHRRPLVPHPPALLDELVQAVASEELGLARTASGARDSAELVERYLRRDVLAPRPLERMAHRARGPT